MAEKKIIRIGEKKKVRVKSKKKVAPLSKQQTFHISKSAMSWMICKPTNVTMALNQQELEDFEL